MKNHASKLITKLVLISTSVIINTGIANEIVLAKSKNAVTCNIYAYVTEQDSQGLNVRNGVGSKNRILGQIPVNETVNIVAALENWVQITNASDGFKGTGWVSLPKLGISTRGYGTNGVDIYRNPNQQSRKIGRIPPSINVKLLGCQGNWAQVEYQGVKGWLAREDQCGAALTTCS